jgi:hypothetical protein
VAWPETWQWLGERFAAQREFQGDEEGAVLDSLGKLLDLITGLSAGGQPKAAENAA